MEETARELRNGPKDAVEPRLAERPAPREVGRLLITCEDRPGIVAQVTRSLFESGANIFHLDQHSSGRGAGTFFMRVEFHLPGLPERGEALRERFALVAEQFGMEWRLVNAGEPKRLVVLVSRADHALLELLWRRQAGDLPAEIVAVISNHADLEAAVAAWGIPFHHVPVESGRKAEAEERQLALLAEYRADAVVLARYMQIVSASFLAHYPNRVINIHHSFLPAFVGANPYAAAYERGVKLIGATAHYVTEQLDAGPIIEQDVQRVDHRQTPQDLRRLGRYIERVVLARAVTWHVEDRVLLHGNKTIVFA
jgi:formyltetrahydrofolate deformylase